MYHRAIFPFDAWQAKPHLCTELIRLIKMAGLSIAICVKCIVGKQDKDLKLMAAQVQHLMASLRDIEALATAVKADAAASCKVCPSAPEKYVQRTTLPCPWSCEPMLETNWLMRQDKV